MPLTPGQADYFRTLEALDNDGRLAPHIATAKQQLEGDPYRERRAEIEQLVRDEPRRRFMRRLRAWLHR